MTKGKRKYTTADDILGRPWCYYCERDFDDLKILISHQKAKHYKCDKCGRRLNTAGGLSVHLNQVHKENLTQVDNALPNRAEPNIEIFGMEGIPEDIVGQHRQRVLQAYYEAEAERRRATGNPPPGGGPTAGGHKKPKIETVDELKARLAAWKAKKLAGDDVTMTDGDNVTPAPQNGDSQEQNGQTQQPHPFPSHASPPPGALAPPFGQPGYGIPGQPPAFAPGQPPFPQGLPGFAPPGQFPPGMPPFAPFPPPGQAHFQQAPSFGPGSQPPPPFNQQRQQAGSPAQNGSLPPAPGLPQRPTFAAPPVNTFQMQQFHQGQPSAPPAGPPGIGSTPSTDPRRRSQDTAATSNLGAQTPVVTEAAVDDLMASVTGEPEVKRPAESAPAEAAPAEKKQKREKDRDRATRLVYSDNDVSPEEKMSTLPKYVFDPKEREEETVLGEMEAAYTGVDLGTDGVQDAAD